MSKSAVTELLRLVVVGAALTASACAQVESPEVLAGGKAILRLAAPGAAQVKVLGDWIKPGETISMAKDAMEKGGGGVWSATVGPLEPGAYIHTFEVDGAAMPDPVNPAAKLRSAGLGSLLRIPGDPPALWEARDVPHGEVHIRSEKLSALLAAKGVKHTFKATAGTHNSWRRYLAETAPLLFQ